MVIETIVSSVSMLYINVKNFQEWHDIYFKNKISKQRISNKDAPLLFATKLGYKSAAGHRN